MMRRHLMPLVRPRESALVQGPPFSRLLLVSLSRLACSSPRKGAFRSLPTPPLPPRQLPHRSHVLGGCTALCEGAADYAGVLCFVGRHICLFTRHIAFSWSTRFALFRCPARATVSSVFGRVCLCASTRVHTRLPAAVSLALPRSLVMLAGGASLPGHGRRLLPGGRPRRQLLPQAGLSGSACRVAVVMNARVICRGCLPRPTTNVLALVVALSWECSHLRILVGGDSVSLRRPHPYSLTHSLPCCYTESPLHACVGKLTSGARFPGLARGIRHQPPWGAPALSLADQEYHGAASCAAGAAASGEPRHAVLYHCCACVYVCVLVCLSVCASVRPSVCASVRACLCPCQ
jgi:hypothetical protein